MDEILVCAELPGLSFTVPLTSILPGCCRIRFKTHSERPDYWAAL